MRTFECEWASKLRNHGAVTMDADYYQTLCSIYYFLFLKICGLIHRWMQIAKLNRSEDPGIVTCLKDSPEEEDTCMCNQGIAPIVTS